MLLPTINKIEHNATTLGTALKHALDCKIAYPVTSLTYRIIGLKVFDERWDHPFTNTHSKTNFFPLIRRRSEPPVTQACRLPCRTCCCKLSLFFFRLPRTGGCPIRPGRRPVIVLQKYRWEIIVLNNLEHRLHDMRRFTGNRCWLSITTGPDISSGNTY